MQKKQDTNLFNLFKLTPPTGLTDTDSNFHNRKGRKN